MKIYLGIFPFPVNKEVKELSQMKKVSTDTLYIIIGILAFLISIAMAILTGKSGPGDVIGI